MCNDNLTSNLVSLRIIAIRNRCIIWTHICCIGTHMFIAICMRFKFQRRGQSPFYLITVDQVAEG